VPAFFAPPSGVAPHGIIAALVAAPAKFLKDADQNQLLASSLSRVPCKQFIEIGCPLAQLWKRLNFPIILEGRFSRSQHLSNRVPRNPQVPGDLPDRLAIGKALAPNPANRLHR
jgi:hypothetical protein